MIEFQALRIKSVQPNVVVLREGCEESANWIVVDPSSDQCCSIVLHRLFVDSAWKLEKQTKASNEKQNDACCMMLGFDFAVLSRGGHCSPLHPFTRNASTVSNRST